MCAWCVGSLTPDPNATVTSVRQVQDLPNRHPLVNTDHRVMTCCCERCGTTTTGTFPADVTAPVQYGPRLNEMAVYLWVDQLIPLRRIGQVIATMTDAQPSQGTIHTMIQSCARRFEPVYAHLGDLVKHEPVTHFDETGMRVAGSLNWVHVAGTATYCYYWLGRSRGDVMTDATGIAVHDHWSSYRCHQSEVHHAFCLAHLVRACQGLAESGETWALKMADHLYRIIRLDQRGYPPSASSLRWSKNGMTVLWNRVFATTSNWTPYPKRVEDDHPAVPDITWFSASNIIVMGLCGVSITRWSRPPTTWLSATSAR